MVCHHLDKSIPEDLAFAESRIRAETVAAEDVLHDQGAISMISSDSQAMGRVAEVVSRTWRTASKMREFRGPLTSLGDEDGKDNARVKRYVSKYTINPCVIFFSQLVEDYLSVCTAQSLTGSAISSVISPSELLLISFFGNPKTLGPSPRWC